MTPTEQYVEVLTHLKSGERSLLRQRSGQRLNESVDGFDLFAGLWWPLRANNQNAPRRAVAWLIAKLYAFRPVEHSPGQTLAWQLGRCQPGEKIARERFQQKFDRMLILPLDNIEPALRWGLDLLNSSGLKLDWAALTNDLSIWERESTRLKWAGEFLEYSKGEQPW
jgi:CRISPR type I-E-associated protein CasB/Cse2